MKYNAGPDRDSNQGVLNHQTCTLPTELYIATDDQTSPTFTHICVNSFSLNNHPAKLFFVCSIDATNTERKGKYINDEEVGSPLNNCVMRLLVMDNYPRLCLFANRDIKAGEELRYDYGEFNLPWRQVCDNFNNC